MAPSLLRVKGYKLLGRQHDLRRFSRKTEYDILDVHDSRWTREINLSWMDAALKHGEPIAQLASSQQCGTILEWERRMLQESGYVRQGAVWMPPG